MTTTRSPEARSASIIVADHAANPERGPMKRVIVGSFTTGALLMLVLTVGVAGGAREHRIAGVALMGAAAGWALLAVLSERLTNHPQRWAFVPAAAMSVTGAALTVFPLDDAALTAAGWVWPPVLLVLTAWLARQSLRHLAGGQRWLMAPALGTLLLTAVGGAYESLASADHSATSAMPGHLYDVGGYRLHLACVGTGSPTVVTESGLGEMSPYWARMAPAVASTTRVCTYDRAGQGWSDSSPHQADGIQTTRDLHALLAAAREKGPFVLAGHSSGGVYAMNYAASYPDQVAGMVLLESSSPRQVELVPSFSIKSEIMRRGLALLPTAARIGLARLVPSSATLPSPAAAQVEAFASSPRSLTNQRDEQGVLQTAMRQAQALTTLGDKPLVVLTARDELTKTPGWVAAQDQLATLSSNSSHGVIDATHATMLDDPSSAAAGARAISDVVRSVRTHAPLPPR
jgi:pimeloyl-ACP methyl ester carboxylesterase